jgi:NADP-dependent 3-hydroxy acid dehydrogenase YdfG
MRGGGAHWYSSPRPGYYRGHAVDRGKKSMRDVEGKVAFITGGASGVGFGMAQVFAANGMKVMIADVRQDHLDRAMAHFGKTNQNVRPIKVDVTDRKAMAEAADETERVFGKVHLVCNNAGINLFNDLVEATYDDYDWVMGVNLGGVINGVVSFIPKLRKHGEGGHICNTGSMASFISGPGAGIYTAAKFAVRGLSEALRYALAPHNIGVSVVCPGLVKSHIYDSDAIRPATLPDVGGAPSKDFMSMLAKVHDAGMEPLEIGEKILKGIRNNDPFIFPHPEFKEELREIFDEVLSYLPNEETPPERMEVEIGRRRRKAEAKAAIKNN